MTPDRPGEGQRSKRSPGPRRDRQEAGAEPSGEQHSRMRERQAEVANRWSQSGRVAEKPVGRSTPPAGIARRKVHADITGADGAEHGVGQGVETNIGIGMADETRLVRYLDAAYSNLVAGAESVYVEALTDANVAEPRRDQNFGGGEILCGRHLQIVLATFDHERSQSRRFGDRSVIGQRATDRSAVRGENGIEVKALGRLRPPQGGTVDRRSDQPVFGAFYRVP